MLTNLTLRNFQCHRKLEVPLSQITTIVGSSDAGKSAVVRALNYVCLNNLRGTSFITHGKDKCAVILEADDQTIQRVKTKTSNTYATETNEYAAVSSEVPPEIAKILNIGEINIANQHDPLFWFSLTSGQLAKELNAIADIAWVDRVLQVSVSDLRRLNAELDVTTSRITELETEAKANEWVLQADEILQKLEAYETRCTEIAQATHKLTELVDRLESSQAQIQKLQTVVDDFQPLVTVYAAQDGIQRQYTRLDTILSSYPDVRPIRAIVRDFEPVQETYKTADTLRQQHSRLASLLTTIPETIPTQDEIDMIQKRLQYCKTVSEGHRRLTEFINQCEDYESQIHALSQDLRATKQQLHEQSEGVCPICRSPLPS